MAKYSALLLALSFVTVSLSANAYTTVSFGSLSTRKPATPTGFLYEPEGVGPFPAVVLAHGCNGIGQNVSNWAKFLQERGYIALVVDSLTPRGVSEVRTDVTGTRVTIGDRAGDAFGALKYLPIPHCDCRDEFFAVQGLRGRIHSGNVPSRHRAQGALGKLSGDVVG